MKKTLVCFGTRPETIKLYPVVAALVERPRDFEVATCATAQHREMLHQALGVFGLVPDHDLDVMTPGQTLAGLAARLIARVDGVLEQAKPDIVIVQGDTATTFACALAAFYRQIRVAHVGAGLRTHDRFHPFPEEINRRLVAPLTDWHFPPTVRASRALEAEGHDPAAIHVVGNTAIDALLMVAERVGRDPAPFARRFNFLVPGRRMVLITGHRRESFGRGFEEICQAIAGLARANPDVDFVYAVHLNPNVREPVGRLLSGIANVHLIEPQDYLNFVWLMSRSDIILTDSGGIQEEAPSLGKPVVVMRAVTERVEAVEAGTAILAGTDRGRITKAVQRLLDDAEEYARMQQAQNPFGDGTAARQIANILARPCAGT